MILPTRTDLLSATLPVERVFDGPDRYPGQRGRVVFRYATEAQADGHLQAERDVLHPTRA